MLAAMIGRRSSADNPSSTLRNFSTESKDWFALCVDTFPTKVVNEQDGYTILRLSEDDDNHRSKHDTLGTYILWEMSDSTVA